MENIIKKIRGTVKSKTVWLLACWQAIIVNIDTIQSLLPQLNEYFGQDIASVVNKIFFIILIYVRVFYTHGSVEDKCKEK